MGREHLRIPADSDTDFCGLMMAASGDQEDNTERLSWWGHHSQPHVWGQRTGRVSCIVVNRAVVDARKASCGQEGCLSPPMEDWGEGGCTTIKLFIFLRTYPYFAKKNLVLNLLLRLIRLNGVRSLILRDRGPGWTNQTNQTVGLVGVAVRRLSGDGQHNHETKIQGTFKRCKKAGRRTKRANRGNILNYFLASTRNEDC